MGTSLAWRTDDQLHDAVRRQLDEDSAIRAQDIAVVAREGVVTLTGFADSYAAKIAAEAAVKSVRGVRAVANDIEVGFWMSAPTRRSRRTRSMLWIATPVCPIA
jgi:osmotically-inducible protein OsmY